jgi:hypothetical protein
MTNQVSNTETLDGTLTVFECECIEDKRYRLIFDGGDSGQYAVEYCLKCFDSDDKLFMISKEELS